MWDRRTPIGRDAGAVTAGRWIAVLVVTTGIVPAACVDETHELQVQALGPETPGVSPGPLHRPGQPCLVCHGEPGPSSHEFVIAGTVYAVQGESAPGQGAEVTMEDTTGSAVELTTNEVGNFYITPDQWAPTFPVGLVTVSKGQSVQEMNTHIGRDGSCADCHTQTPGPTSFGPVYLDRAPTDGGP